MYENEQEWSYMFLQMDTNRRVKGELWCKMKIWSNKTLVPSQSFSEICFHDNQM